MARGTSTNLWYMRCVPINKLTFIKKKVQHAQSYGRYYAHSCEADWSVAGDVPSSVWLRSELSEPENGDCRPSEDMVKPPVVPTSSSLA